MMNSLIKMLYLQVYLMGMVPHYEILMSWKIKHASEKYTYSPIFNTGIYVAESLCCPPETIAALLIGYNSIQNKMLEKTIYKKSMWGISIKTLKQLEIGAV